MSMSPTNNAHGSDQTSEVYVSPASHAQQRLYYLSELIDNPFIYQIPLVFMMKGKVEVLVLKRAVQFLIDRHEALRTHFMLEGDELMQIIYPAAQLDWHVRKDGVDIKQWIEEEASRPFCLQTGPLFRASLFYKAEHEIVLMLNMHHIIADGWSVGILVRELLSSYQTLVTGQTLELLEPDFQYADYAAWQSEWLRTRAAQNQLEYWTTRLGGELPVLQFSYDRLHTEKPRYDGESYVFTLPPDTFQAIKNLCQSFNSTLFIGLFTVFTILLNRYTGLEDILVGVPIANRNRKEFEQIVGLFVNTLVLRTSLAGSPSFYELMKQNLLTTLEAYDHQDLPFEKVVEKLNPQRSPYSSPLFQVMFSLQNTQPIKWELPDISIEPIEVDTRTAKFELTLDMVEEEGNLKGVFEYRSDLFTRQTIKRLAQDYCQLVKQVVENPDLPLHALPPLELEKHATISLQSKSLPHQQQPDQASLETFVGAQNQVEQALADIWSQVLHVERVGIDDNYFSVGGDSIRSLQIVSQAKERGLEIELLDLMLYQTIRTLAPHVTPIETPATKQMYEPFALLPEKDRALISDAIEDAYPLSRVQAGMVYHSEITATHKIYQNVTSYHIRASYSEEAWIWTLSTLLARHQILRTAFHLHLFSEPMQLVYKHVEPRITFEDLRSLSAEEQEIKLQERFEIEQTKPFQWEQPSFLRLHIQRRTEQTFQLWFVEHHAILDGWSERSLFAEMCKLYLFRLSGGEQRPPAALEKRYRDFVEQERQAIQSEKHKTFWTEFLHDMTSTKLSRWRISDRTGDMKIVECALPTAISADLHHLAKRLNVSIKFVLLAAHVRVMSLLGGCQDVVTGVVYNGRSEEKDGDKVIGVFLNTLPFRVNLSGGTWIDLIRQVADIDQKILQHRRYPMAEIQQQLGNVALFEAFFNYTHFHVEQSFPEKDVFEILEEDGVWNTNFAFGAEFAQDGTGERIALHLRFDAAQFEKEQIQQIGAYYQKAFESIIASPESQYQTISLLSTSELEQYAAWNATEKVYPVSHVLHELFERQVARTPQGQALVFADQIILYQELNERANQLAHRLSELGAGPGKFVGLCLERSIEMVISLLAILKAGAAFVPIDPEHPTQRIHNLIQEAQISILLSQHRWREQVDMPDLTIEWVEDIWERNLSYPTSNFSSSVTPDDPAYLIFTSGSTGKPKGVVISHRAISNRLLWMQEAYGLEYQEKVLQKTAYTFDVAVWEFFWPLISGACLVVAQAGGHRDPGYLSQIIQEQQVTTLHFVPSMLQSFLEAGEIERCTSLKRVICSGESLPYTLQCRFFEACSADLYNLYGPTEAAIDVTAWKCREDGGGIVPIGVPIANLQVYVFDSFLQPVPLGVTGELYIGGVGLAEGYYQQPELTAERFITYVHQSGRRIRLYRTGDQARYLPGGVLEYRGRLDNQVKIRGMRVELGEIEAVLSRHEAVSECVVRFLDDRLIAYLVATRRQGTETQELITFLKGVLPDYMLPSAWIYLDQIPMNTNGKRDVKALPAPAPGDFDIGQTYFPPRDQWEWRLVKLWEELFLARPISIHADFFRLGGNSLLALRLMALINGEFGQELPLSTLLQNGTIARMAQLLRTGQEANAPDLPLITLQAEGTHLPLFLIHPIGGTTFCYGALASVLGADFPVYAVSAQGLEDRKTPFTTVEDMAERYIEILRTKQPEGPYRLGGWSFGGVVAFEVARRLRQRGQEVALLTMIDSAFPVSDLLHHDQRRYPELFAEELISSSGYPISNSLDEYISQQVATLTEQDEQLRAILEVLKENQVMPDMVFHQFKRYFTVFQSNLQAWLRYQPESAQSYPGAVTYIQSAETVEAATQWESLITGPLTIHRLAANHYQIMQFPYVTQVGRILREQL